MIRGQSAPYCSLVWVPSGEARVDRQVLPEPPAAEWSAQPPGLWRPGPCRRRRPEHDRRYGEGAFKKASRPTLVEDLWCRLAHGEELELAQVLDCGVQLLLERLLG